MSENEYFEAPDGHDEPTLWLTTPMPAYPQAILRRRDFIRWVEPHHWDEIVARVMAGNPVTQRNT